MRRNLRPHPRYQRSRNFRIGDGLQRSANLVQQGLLFRKRSPASPASGDVQLRRAGQYFAADSGLGQRFTIGFTKHRNFSARVFRAKESRDFTVPTGTASNKET